MTPAAPSSAAPSRLSLYLNLIRWDRPAGTYLLLTGRPPYLHAALWMAADGWPGWHLLLVFAIGTFLMRSAGCAVNDVADRDFDKHVKRTAQRPVTAGLVSVREALGLGAVLSLIAFALVLTTNPPTILLSFAALGVTILYPFTKRWVSMPQAVLGVAFSFGIPMAFSAALGGKEWSIQAIAASVPLAAWGLLAANLFWVLAYDTEYAMVDRDDDIRIGIQTSALTLGRFDVIGVMAFYVVFLALWAALGLRLGMGHWFLAGLAAAAAQVVWHYALIKDRTRDGCFKAFRENHWVGFAIFAGTALDLALR